MLNRLKNLWMFALSFITPQDKKVVVLAGDAQKIDISGLSREEIRALGSKDDHLATYRPWPGSYYTVVGTVVGDAGKVFYRFKDPISKKEFMLDRELRDILLYHDTIRK